MEMNKSRGTHLNFYRGISFKSAKAIEDRFKLLWQHKLKLHFFKGSIIIRFTTTMHVFFSKLPYYLTPSTLKALSGIKMSL